MFSTLKLSIAGIAAGLASPAFVTLMALSTPASADTVFSNFGPGDSYDVSSGWVVGGATSEQGFSQWAFAFTPSGNFTLAQIEVAISNSASPISVMLSLDHASAGLPGGTIESWTLTDLPVFGVPPLVVQTVTPVSRVSLISGNEYWLVASADGDTIDAWNLALPGPNTPAALNTGSGWALRPLGPLEFSGVFAVEGSAVPEPSTWASMLMGFAALGFVGYRQTRGLKLQAA
jgi:hypothetical protein